MSTLVAVLSTALIPLTSVISASIYLSINPASPARHFTRRPGVQLPTERAEGLVGAREKDPFELDDPVVCHEGDPVGAERFWSSMRRRKLALLLTMALPFVCNIVVLVFTAMSDLTGDDKTRAILIPSLLLPAHLIVLLMSSAFLRQNSTTTHWSTTIHLAVDLFMQFLIVTTLAMLPSAPIPSPQPASQALLLAVFSQLDIFKLPSNPVDITRSILPILQFPPLLLIMTTRRGPPLHLPLDSIYPPKITDAVPAGHRSLDPCIPNVSGEAEETIMDYLLFAYATKVVREGYHAETMDVWDLPILTADMRALPSYQTITRVYGSLHQRLGRLEGFNLLFKLAKANAGYLTGQTILAAATAVGYYVPHWLLRQFIVYLENDPTRSQPAWGWLLAFEIFVSNAVMYIAAGLIWSLSTVTLQGRMKLQLNSMLFAKTLRKKDIAGKGDETGKNDSKEQREKDEIKDEDESVSNKSQIMTLFTVDVDRVTEFVFHEFSLIDSPIEIVVATVFLYALLGNSAFVGLLATLICLPLNHFASKIVVRAQENLMKTRDQRTALMNEILQGIRMLKFMAWERSFEKRVNDIRKSELHWQARNFQIEVAFNCIWALTPVLVTVVSFLHFVLVSQQKLTPSIAFTSVAVFGELRFALNALPETFIQALQGFVSCRRIEKYMALAEVEAIEPYTGNGDIVLVNATFTWPRDDSAASQDVDGVKSTPATPRAEFTLADLSLRFPHAQLSLICGRLGSGKTLLLHGLLGEADLLAGSIDRPRSLPNAMAELETISHIPDEEWVLPNMVGYVPQQAWLQNASIKENVVFSSPWDAVRYQLVLEACSLLSDLEVMEDGDLTEIGERGLNLSGGQKARVSLARAVYSRASLLYLDDVLSAVDAHTAHALMENCIQGPLLAERTVLMVSHHTALVAPAAAYIVALENGDVKFAGTRNQFIAGGLLAELDDDARPPETPMVKQPTIEEDAEKKGMPIQKTHRNVMSLSVAAQPGAEPDSETSSLAPDDETTTLVSSKEEAKKQPRKLIEDEKREKGRIAWPVWRTYFKALGGPLWWTFFAFSVSINIFLPVAEKGWLQYWTGSSLGAQTHSTLFYVIGYALITLLGSFLENLQYAFQYYGSLQASRKLHSKMLETVLFATLRFHDTISRGRLLNRFGKDIEGLDSKMGDNFVRTLSYGLSTVVTFLSITYVGGWKFFIALCVCLIFYYRAGSIYGQTSRDMRRLDSITRSPLYSMFGETVSGVAVIRAFGASTISLKYMLKLTDTNLLAFVWTWTVNRWLSARFNVLSSFVVGLTAVTILITPGTNAAMAGFAMSFANTIAHELLFVVRRFVQLEQSMVALERIKEYSELKIEAAEFVDPRPSALWPQSGAISVEKLTIRYAPDLPDVLHGISFQVAAKEKIGIVGATGCGKSTLALSFFRFVEAFQGRITIDEIDIAKIGLTDLRSRVTIIPQDPTILSGTLRSTLDVFDEYDDVDIYAALRRVHLLKDADVTADTGDATSEDEELRNKNVFRDLSNPVSEGGDNFSSGEKQLICMARAILRRNRLLFMDEATASIDYETDELISKTIREEFSDSTILTIAHRIHTIIDFDRVLVMEQGRIAEFASPAELLRNHKSKFYALCKATGRTEFTNLKTMAAEAERKRKKDSA